MRTLPLGNTGRTTTRLGFGCSSIMGALNRRQSLALLEAAYDAGICHFDTAPMYGYGEAESCLGEFLNRHRGEVTVTTKFGIPAPDLRKRGITQLARASAGPLVQRFPALKRRLQQTFAAVQQPALVKAPVANLIFNAEQARVSLEKSLTALRTDRIDLWLLHDVKPLDLAVDATSEPLLRLLEDSVAQGKIGMFGVGTDREVVPRLVAEYPQICQVLQYEWSVLNPIVSPTANFRIHHRALGQNFHRLAEALKVEPLQCERWSSEVGADLASSRILAQVMLKVSLVLNPASVILVSSKRPEHIRANVHLIEDDSLKAPARRLYELVQREGLKTTSL